MPSTLSREAVIVRCRAVVARLRSDARGATAVEYVILVGCVALCALASFRYFGEAVADKALCQARAVVTLSNVACVQDAGALADLGGLESSDQTAEGGGGSDRDCAGWRAIGCAANEMYRRIDDIVGAGMAFGAAALSNNVSAMFWGDAAIEENVENFVLDAWHRQWSALEGIGHGVRNLFGAGSQGVGVVEAWENVVTGFTDLFLLTARGNTARGELIAWDDWANGRYGEATGQVIFNIAAGVLPIKVLPKRMPHRGNHDERRDDHGDRSDGDDKPDDDDDPVSDMKDIANEVVTGADSSGAATGSRNGVVPGDGDDKDDDDSDETHR